MKHIDDVTRDVIGLSMRIHTALGPGLFESVYETVLAGKLIELGYTVERQIPINIEFEGTQFPNAFKKRLAEMAGLFFMPAHEKCVPHFAAGVRRTAARGGAGPGEGHRLLLVQCAELYRTRSGFRCA